MTSLAGGSYDSIRSLSPDDLLALLQKSKGVVAETETFDLKQQAYSSSEQDKAECAKDLAAFANSRGGRLLIGASEANGNLDELHPLTPDQAEVAKQSIENLAVSKVEEPLTFIRSCSLRLPDGNCLVLVDVPFSPRRPHAVRLQPGKYGYPLRAGTRNEWITVTEVRRLFREQIEQETRGRSRLEWVLKEVEEEIGDAAAVLFYAAPSALPDHDVIKDKAAWWAALSAAIPNTNRCLPFPDPHNSFHQLGAFIERWELRRADQNLLVYRNGLVAAWVPFNRFVQRAGESCPKGLCDDFSEYFVRAAVSIIPEQNRAGGTSWGLRVLNSKGLGLSLGRNMYPDTRGAIVRREREMTEFRVDDAEPTQIAIAEYQRRFALAFGYEEQP